MFCAGHPDIFPAGDLALQQGGAAWRSGLTRSPTIKEMIEHGAAWSPHRSRGGAAVLALLSRHARTREGLPSVTKLSGPMLPPRSAARPSRLVVLLHGYGADGSDLIGLGQHWGRCCPMRCSSRPTRRRPAPAIRSASSGFRCRLDRIVRPASRARRRRAPVIVDFLIDSGAQTGHQAGRHPPRRLLARAR